MDEWDGYRWVDGWPVSPPKQEQEPSEQEMRVQQETNTEQEMLEEKDGEQLPPPLAPIPTHHTVQVTPFKDDTSVNADGSVVSGSSYITSRLSESDEDYRDYEQKKISLGSGYI